MMKYSACHHWLFMVYWQLNWAEFKQLKEIFYYNLSSVLILFNASRNEGLSHSSEQLLRQEPITKHSHFVVPGLHLIYNKKLLLKLLFWVWNFRWTHRKHKGKESKYENVFLWDKLYISAISTLSWLFPGSGTDSPQTRLE